MKRAVAIVLLIIHFFNLGGYMLLHLYALDRSDRFMNELISKDLYNPNALIEIKVKQNLPGINEWSDYKNVNGQIQFKEACYNYVKLKFTKDTLYVMCVLNYEKTKLIKSNIIYAKEINDIPQDNKDNSAQVKKGGADNNYRNTVIEYRFLSFINLPPLVVKPLATGITEQYIPVDGQPPEYLS
ncbi:hypothetical protein [Mucilaginibacter glaciei]|uniref:Uncharacterized protein n=1 Tax=Mucilaginibacter glaciei TaxID=2772109 RepID=A0A926NQG6_9SPHI|nr:hypothetical protein [Mucilaginibacter glaciei]MBD1393167.1 hypothetical protein [Mucilaginibacter glaciei]